MEKKKLVSIIVFVVGVITLVIGGVFLGVRLNQGETIEDGEYLVTVGSFRRDDEPGVVWNFTEIGKGTLTTNEHLNDYDFVWAIEDNRLRIKTEWLYELDDEYEYEIRDGDLIIVKDSVEIRFRPGGSVNSEVGEDN